MAKKILLLQQKLRDKHSEGIQVAKKNPQANVFWFFSKLQMGFFCQINFCQSRKNGFISTETLPYA